MNDTTVVPSFYPARARALRSFAQRRGFRRYLGLPLSACAACDAGRISGLVISASGRARRVGVLRGRKRSYEVLTAPAGPLPLRMLVARDARGRRTIVSVDHRPPAAPPPRYLGELEALELEEELRSMNVHVRWEPRAMTSKEADDRFGEYRHLIYIPLDASGEPLKAGETTRPLKARYPGDKINTGGRAWTARSYWVGRVFTPKKVPGSKKTLWVEAPAAVVKAVEHVVARRLSRGGAALPASLIRRRGDVLLPLEAGGAVYVRSPVPASLHARYKDKPKEPGVVGAARSNSVTLAIGDRYEMEAAPS